MRVKGYSKDKAVNRMLQMQVRREIKTLTGNASASAPAVLSAAVTIVVFSTTVVMTAFATITLEIMMAHRCCPIRKKTR